MNTFVGTQAEFHDALYSLCELDYDAVEAYKAAINHLHDESYKQRLMEFMHDHMRHIEEISNLLNKHHFKVPGGPDMKQYLTQGKVILGNLLGDKAILKAMITNEIDTNTAYERLNQYTGQWDDAKGIISQGLLDEKKHKIWLEETVHNYAE